MSKIGQREWQDRQILLQGASYVNPTEVFEEYQDVIYSANVMGRPDLASALQSRVSMKLCEHHAATLKCIMLLARKPMSNSVILDVPIQESHPICLNDNNDTITPSFTHEYSDEEISEFSEYTDTEPIDPSKIRLDSVQFKPLKTQDPFALLSRPRLTLCPSTQTTKLQTTLHCTGDIIDTSSGDVKNAQFKEKRKGSKALLNELCLCLYQFNYRIIGDGYTETCKNSMFTTMLGYRDCLSEKAWEARTVPQLLAICEHNKYLKLKKPQRSEKQDLMNLNTWMQNDEISNVPSKYKVSHFSLALEYIKYLKLMGVRPVDFDPPAEEHMYFLYMVRHLLRLRMQLFGSDFRSLLLEHWNLLAAVYLAHDPRMLILLNELREIRIVSTYDNVKEVRNSVLYQVWKDAPFEFDIDGLPVLNLRINAKCLPLEIIERFFPTNKLIELFICTQSAFMKEDQSRELENEAVYKLVANQISSLLYIKCLI